MTEAQRKKADKIIITKGDVWISEGGHKLTIVDYNEKHKIVTYRINSFLDDREAPAIQIKAGIVRGRAKLRIKNDK